MVFAAVCLIALPHQTSKAEDRIEALPKAPAGITLEVQSILRGAPNSFRPPYHASDYRLVYRNDGDQNVTFHVADFWTQHRIVVRNRSGTEAVLSALGREHRKWLTESYLNRDHNSDKVLKPGESFTREEFLDPADLYSLNEGEYSLSVEYCEQAEHKMRLVSQRLPFFFTARR